eukprot:SAG25_NODE_32_length_20323_cov_59.467721_10_plen_145_part_00
MAAAKRGAAAAWLCCMRWRRLQALVRIRYTAQSIVLGPCQPGLRMKPYRHEGQILARDPYTYDVLDLVLYLVQLYLCAGRAPVNFTCISWTTGVSSPCHFYETPILELQSYYEISPMRRSILLVEVESLPISHNPYHSCIRHGR